jgi:malonyl-CoA decarboxylase
VFERLQQARRSARERSDLARLIADCRALLGARGESNSVAIADAAVGHYRKLSPESLKDFFTLLAEEFDPDPQQVLELAGRYAQSRAPEDLIALTRAAEPPRQELLRRLIRAPGGTAAVLSMRAQLLARLRGDPRLAAVDADFQHLLASWFNPGFLELHQVDWDSPARLLEQLIRHEAVHEIDGWDDLRRRLQPDRRCFAFFHPALPGEPLIFVEVALLEAMPAAIAPLLDRDQPPAQDPRRFKVAAFYSISNCQPGLRGVNLGNFLIKQVAQRLQARFPALRTFCTLSPVPSFADWLAKVERLESDRLKPARLKALDAALQAWRARREGAGAAEKEAAPELADDAELLRRLCAFHLLHTSAAGLRASDPVARFHLGNGARLERINTGADLTRKGLKQSHGLMVNYLYDLDEIEANHERFVNEEVNASRAVTGLL